MRRKPRPWRNLLLRIEWSFYQPHFSYACQMHYAFVTRVPAAAGVPHPLGCHRKDLPAIHDDCTRRMSDCYRDSSVLLHLAVAVGDTMEHISRGRLRDAFVAITSANNLRSAKSLLEGTRTLRRLASTQP